MHEQDDLPQHSPYHKPWPSYTSDSYNIQNAAEPDLISRGNAPVNSDAATQTDPVPWIDHTQQTAQVDGATQAGPVLDSPELEPGQARYSPVQYVADLSEHQPSSLVATSDLQAGPTATLPSTIIPGVATQVAPVIEPDSDLSDEAYVESTTTSYVSSIASEICKGILENGRLYPSYGKNGYGLPTDEPEMDRLDLQHHKYRLVIGNKHFLAPIPATPHHILDLACGTGIWALDIADMFPSAQVLGVDIAPIQPAWVAANCQFEIDDIEESWTYKPATFDFIHGRDFLYCLRDYPRLLRQCYDALKPGGYVELACILPRVMCDDGSMPAESAFKTVCDKFYEASCVWGTPCDAPLRYAQYLRDAGFVDVAEHIFKVPSAPWPRDRRLKQIGALEMTNLVEGAQGFGLRVFGEVFGWSREKIEYVMMEFRRDVKNRAYHQYCLYFVVYGRKPLGRSDDVF